MTFPSTLSSLTDPQSTDKLNSPSHSAIEQAQNAAIEQIEAVVGTASSALGTIQYDLRATASGGGGHVQSANKGGTGQTSFNKGDLLVAQSSSVITKVTVGVDNQVLKADSSVATGVKWANALAPKIGNSASVITYFDNTAETSIMTATVPASTLGTSNALSGKVFIKDMSASSGRQFTIRGYFGTTSVATITIPSIYGGSTNSSVTGYISLDLVANGAVNAQRGVLQTYLYKTTTPLSPASSFVGQVAYGSGVAAEDGGASKAFGITAQMNGSDSPPPRIDTDGYIIQQISS